jgi:CBS domain-containing protein
VIVTLLHVEASEGLLTLPGAATVDQLAVPLSAILQKKGTIVHQVASDATVADALIVMNGVHVGCVVVVDQSALVGVFTERDVLVRVVSEYRDPRTILVRDVMNKEVYVATPQTTLGEALHLMVNLRFRHLPILGEDGALLGLVSSGDLTAWLATHLGAKVHELECYIHGTYLP